VRSASCPRSLHDALPIFLARPADDALRRDPAQAGHRDGERFRTGRRTGAGDVLPPAHRRGHGQGRPAGNQPRPDPGLWRHPAPLRLAGRAATLELCLAGAPVDAQRALQLGIVNQVVPAAELEARTFALAGQLAAAAPLALRGILDCVNFGGECSIEEGLAYEAAQFGLVFSTEDMREGTRAFLERRKPAFAGR